jgi:hypothetical protein
MIGSSSNFGDKKEAGSNLVIGDTKAGVASNIVSGANYSYLPKLYEHTG